MTLFFLWTLEAVSLPGPCCSRDSLKDLAGGPWAGGCSTGPSWPGTSFQGLSPSSVLDPKWWLRVSLFP